MSPPRPSVPITPFAAPEKAARPAPIAALEAQGLVFHHLSLERSDLLGVSDFPFGTPLPIEEGQLGGVSDFWHQFTAASSRLVYHLPFFPL